jgi:WD40 repeat protein
LWHVNYENKQHQHVTDLDGHTDWVNQILLVPEARNTLISCSNDTTIQIWRLDDLNKIKSRKLKPFSTLNEHQDYVRCIDYSLASGKLFSCSDDGELNLFDLHAEKLLQKYEIWDKEKKPFE